jgi:hypothetical protein
MRQQWASVNLSLIRADQMTHPFKGLLLGALSLAALGAGTTARADIYAQYFEAQADGRDFGPTICCFANNNEVLSTLGPDGLPVFNTASTPTLLDVNSKGELNWWTPSTGSSTSPVEIATGTQTISGNSFTNSAFYPPNGTGQNDATGFQTAIFSGSFNLNTAQTVDFTLGADDDALLYVDGTAAVILGGIHGVTTADNDVSLAAGDHTFELFYADRQQSGAGLFFSVPNDIAVAPTPPPVSGVPEPGVWVMMLTGVALMGAALRFRRKRDLPALVG